MSDDWGSARLEYAFFPSPCPLALISGPCSGSAQEREEREKREAEARRKEKLKSAIVTFQGEPYT